MKATTRIVLGALLVVALLFVLTGARKHRGSTPNYQTGEVPADPVPGEQVELAEGLYWYKTGLGCGGWMPAAGIFPTQPRSMILGTDIGGVYCSEDRGLTWRPDNVGLYEMYPRNLYAHDIMGFDNGTIRRWYLANGGGIFYRNLDGTSWTRDTPVSVDDYRYSYTQDIWGGHVGTTIGFNCLANDGNNFLLAGAGEKRLFPWAMTAMNYEIKYYPVVKKMRDVIDASLNGSTYTGDSGESWVLDQWIGGFVSITGGTNSNASNQNLRITDSGTNTVTVASWPGGTPSTDSDFRVVSAAPYTESTNDDVLVPTVYTATTIGSSARSYSTNQWKGGSVMITQGKGITSRPVKITGSDATTVTVAAWPNGTPDATSSYHLSTCERGDYTLWRKTLGEVGSQWRPVIELGNQGTARDVDTFIFNTTDTCIVVSTRNGIWLGMLDGTSTWTNIGLTPTSIHANSYNKTLLATDYDHLHNTNFSFAEEWSWWDVHISKNGRIYASLKDPGTSNESDVRHGIYCLYDYRSPGDDWWLVGDNATVINTQGSNATYYAITGTNSGHFWMQVNDAATGVADTITTAYDADAHGVMRNISAADVATPVWTQKSWHTWAGDYYTNFNVPETWSDYGPNNQGYAGVGNDNGGNGWTIWATSFAVCEKSADYLLWPSAIRACISHNAGTDWIYTDSIESATHPEYFRLRIQSELMTLDVEQNDDGRIAIASGDVSAYISANDDGVYWKCIPPKMDTSSNNSDNSGTNFEQETWGQSGWAVHWYQDFQGSGYDAPLFITNSPSEPGKLMAWLDNGTTQTWSTVTDLANPQYYWFECFDIMGDDIILPFEYASTGNPTSSPITAVGVWSINYTGGNWVEQNLDVDLPQPLAIQETETDATTPWDVNSISKSGNTWTSNQWIGYQVEIYGGTGSGQTRTIVQNTSTMLYVYYNGSGQVWTTTPDNTSDFRIRKQGHLQPKEVAIDGDRIWMACIGNSTATGYQKGGLWYFDTAGDEAWVEVANWPHTGDAYNDVWTVEYDDVNDVLYAGTGGNRGASSAAIFRLEDASTVTAPAFADFEIIVNHASTGPITDAPEINDPRGREGYTTERSRARLTGIVYDIAPEPGNAGVFWFGVGRWNSTLDYSTGIYRYDDGVVTHYDENARFKFAVPEIAFTSDGRIMVTGNGLSMAKLDGSRITEQDNLTDGDLIAP